MSTQTAHEDVRIVDSVDDGGKLLRRAPAAAGAVAGLALATVLVAIGGTPAAWLAPAIVVAAMAAVHDLRSGRLPDALVGATAMFGFMGAVGVRGVDGIGLLAAGALALSLPLLAFHLISPCSMGFGDVKFAAAIGGLVGIAGVDASDGLFLAMTALTVASGVAVVAAVTARRRHVPFGPSMYVGVCAALVFAVATRSPFA